MLKDVLIGEGTKIWNIDLVNLYNCTIGKNCSIGTFSEIGSAVVIGDNCKIQAHVFIPSGVIIEDEVFIGPRVCFTNDKYPRAVGPWTLANTIVKKGASIGANATILPGITIGEGAMVGAGSVVTKDVEPHTTVYGNPARKVK